MPDGHKLEIRSKDESRVDYYLKFSGEITDAGSLSHEDNVIENGTAISGAVAGGIDRLWYTGRKEAIRVSSPAAQLSINDKAWADATAYGARVDGSMGSGGSGGSSGSGGGGAPSPGGGASPDMNERVELASGRDRPEDVQTFRPDEASAFERLVRETEAFMRGNVRAAIGDGTYDVGVLEGTVSSRGGAPLLRVTGNVENPYAVVIDGPTNIGKLNKDEHLHLEGFECSQRTQLWGVGHVLCRDMAFSDRNGKGHSSLAGKPVAFRIQGSDVGHKDHPDRWASYLYGDGSAYFDTGSTLRATEDAYVVVANTATVHFANDVKFASGRKEVIEGSGVYPEDMDGHEVFIAGERVT